MSQLYHFPDNAPWNGAKALQVPSQIRFYFPCPTVKVALISNNQLEDDQIASCRILHLANQAVKEFALNSSEVVWVEHTLFQGKKPSHTGFNLLNFDWRAGQASHFWRSPIYEDWYLSWLKTEISFDDRDSN
ncbi:MAG: hypothetical protein WCA35_29230 [Kovacikia sp.]